MLRSKLSGQTMICESFLVGKTPGAMAYHLLIVFSPKLSGEVRRWPFDPAPSAEQRTTESNRYST